MRIELILDDYCNCNKKYRFHAVSADGIFEREDSFFLDDVFQIYDETVASKDFRVGDCVFVNNVFTLITKPRFGHITLNIDFMKSLLKAKRIMKENDISTIAMPMLCSNKTDRIKFKKMTDMLGEAWGDMHLTIYMYCNRTDLWYNAMTWGKTPKEYFYGVTLERKERERAETEALKVYKEKLFKTRKDMNKIYLIEKRMEYETHKKYRAELDAEKENRRIMMEGLLKARKTREKTQKLKEDYAPFHEKMKRAEEAKKKYISSREQDDEDRKRATHLQRYKIKDEKERLRKLQERKETEELRIAELLGITVEEVRLHHADKVGLVALDEDGNVVGQEYVEEDYEESDNEGIDNFEDYVIIDNEEDDTAGEQFPV